MDFLNFINDGVVEVGLDVNSKDDVFRALHDRLYACGKVKESFYLGLVDREKVFPTGLLLNNYNVAIPHTDAHHVEKSSIAVATLKNPVTFQCMDDETKSIDVRVIFMLALGEAHSHMEVLQQLMLLIQDELFLENLLRARNKEELIELINKKCKVA
ncbi:MAG: PTS sugar transporter subunit IIA [Clostridiaceae bacterium]